MGEEVSINAFSYVDRRHFRTKLRRCVDALRVLIDEDRFDTERTLTGLELELNLVTEDCDPAMRNAEVLSALAHDMANETGSVQPELGKFNLELNLTPRTVNGDGLSSYERVLRDWLHRIDEHAAKVHASLALIGMLPTVRSEQAGPDVLSHSGRYRLLNERILAARGEEIALDIEGVERVQSHYGSIAAESVNTSVQYHLQLTPGQFPRYWNAAQAIAAAQLAAGANSPYLFGSRLWDETRIVLFEQATDTRPRELREQGVRPRTWFGEAWIGDVGDLFEENLRFFPALLSILEAEDPFTVLDRGGVPQLGELRLHNGTIYRWNRPVYDVTASGPHLRVENRVLPAGPTPADICANLAFFLGLVTEVAAADTPIEATMTFAQARDNFYTAARYGLGSVLEWPGIGRVDARRLIAETLLPLAANGLDRLGTDRRDRDRFLSIIYGRCSTGVNGAVWQDRCVRSFEERDGLDRDAALHAMMRRYLRYSSTNTPVHEWPER
ncbi:glutamate--cysteine ligase [Stackebrandtia soli]|uniref:glutamate--cysteine ligase n=1 Tax=Stackebrandtia soli TaxID=1892856 RepID=UPI0039EC6A66